MLAVNCISIGPWVRAVSEMAVFEENGAGLRSFR
jgi:hypothetical protein